MQPDEQGKAEWSAWARKTGFSIIFDKRIAAHIWRTDDGFVLDMDPASRDAVLRALKQQFHSACAYPDADVERYFGVGALFVKMSDADRVYFELLLG